MVITSWLPSPTSASPSKKLKRVPAIVSASNSPIPPPIHEIRFRRDDGRTKDSRNANLGAQTSSPHTSWKDRTCTTLHQAFMSTAATARPVQLSPRRRSSSIRIPQSNSASSLANDDHDTIARDYEMATWRMYYRILDHRNRHAEEEELLPVLPLEDEQVAMPSLPRPSPHEDEEPVFVLDF